MPKSNFPSITQNNLNSLDKVLVVGSWAKEQATIENLKENKKLDVFSYMDTKNPGIIKVAEGYKIGPLHQTNDIVDYALKKQVDLVLITTAEPLSQGLVDALESENVVTFAPRKKAAQLETNKLFARKLMQRYEINALPRFQAFKKAKEAINYAKKLDWKVAVKPIGLTEGLGVKVYGDQLGNPEDVKKYITNVLEKEIGNAEEVLIEEKMKGEEFTIQCFVNGEKLVATPCVQDFKKLLSGGKGPNTASMGSYATKRKVLPFMNESHYEEALEIMRKTLRAYKKETGEACRGILYGQFIITPKGLRLVEYNFRPGDPEWLNTLAVMKNNLRDIILRLLQDEQVSLDFQPKPTVCKYIVPPQYPEKLHQTLDVSFDLSEIQQAGAKIYYSCGLGENQKLNIGSERGLALIAKGKTIERANQKIESAISKLEGDFHYRSDIGTRELIGKAMENISGGN